MAATHKEVCAHGYPLAMHCSRCLLERPGNSPYNRDRHEETEADREQAAYDEYRYRGATDAA
jgi:hypothetical protein